MKKLDAEQKKRAKSLALRALTAIGIGLLYYIAVKLIGQGIPCVLSLITKKYCPGCGISRMFIALIEGDLSAAFGYNAAVMFLLPFALVFGARRAYVYVKVGNRDSYTVPETVFLVAAFVILVVFAIMRNMPQFAFLAP